ncbi:hypothetical protein, partial [Thiolapillus sp.]|uniref:hypothetical protein n=1 Tax=Thiolapillus sp. TaxID=2017437 RepID=UPI003AF51B8C
MFSLWRKARRENSAASRLLGSTSLRFALHGWQRLWLTPHSSEPVTECRRLGESVEIQHATQRLITLKMTNII